MATQRPPIRATEPIPGLPTEIFVMVCDYLTVGTKIKKLGMCSTLTRKVVLEKCHTQSLELTRDSKGMTHFFEFATSSKNKHYFRNVTRLKCTLKINKTHPPIIGHFMWSDFTKTVQSGCFPSLQHLCLSATNWIEDVNFSEVAKRLCEGCPSITSLNIHLPPPPPLHPSILSRFDTALFLSGFTHLSNLTSVRLGGLTTLWYLADAVRAGELEKLQHLALPCDNKYSMYGEEVDVCVALANYCPHLLHIEFLGTARGEHLQAIQTSTVQHVSAYLITNTYGLCSLPNVKRLTLRSKPPQYVLDCFPHNDLQIEVSRKKHS